MIFFFDYFYMKCCDYYQKFRSERVGEEWRTSGIFLLSTIITIFFAFLNILYYGLYLKPSIGTKESFRNDFTYYSWVGTIILFIILFIRYKKIISYEEIVGKARELTVLVKSIYHILMVVFILIAFPLTFILAIYFSPKDFSF